MLHLGTTDAGPYTLKRSRLTTHGVVVGMTGSGKTGLCIDLLEEVALSGVPVLAIDPKGDLANLGRPWPAGEADRWAEGLAASGVSQERIDALRDQVEVVVHTPGSTASRPLDVLGTLTPPPGASPEALAEAAESAATALLALAGVEGDPLRDPAPVVTAAIVRAAWEGGETLDAEQVVLRLVDPPFAKVGVFPVDTFWPRDARMKVAMALNAVLASATFAPWRQGEALDIDALLAPIEGKTPVRVLYLAHLDDAQRQFVVGLVLSRLVAWMRRQEGTSDLRALLFFDEVMGYLPPHPARPASKPPLLTLLKQARAIGLGVVLCTQNPVDLDYKALANAGWWAVGRLDTAQDRERVLDGMVGADGTRSEVASAMQGLPPWTFLVRDVREQGLKRVKSRWAISWLGGPRTLEELRAEASAAPHESVAPPVAASAPPQVPDDDTVPEPPPVPKGLEVRWLRPDHRFRPPLSEVLGSGDHGRSDGAVVYRAALLATADMLFDERGGFRHQRRAQRVFFPWADDAEAVDVELDGGELSSSAAPSARYHLLDGSVDERTEVQRFQKAVRTDLLAGETTQLFKHRPTKLASRGGESRESFEGRVAAAVQEAVDADVAKLRGKVEKQVDRLEAKRADVERSIARYRDEAQAKLASEVVNAGETLFGMLFGGRRRSLTSAVSRRGTTSRAQARVSDAEEKLRQLDRDLYDAEVELQDDIAAIEREHEATRDNIEVVEVGLEASDLDIRFTLVWVPQTRSL